MNTVLVEPLYHPVDSDVSLALGKEAQAILNNLFKIANQYCEPASRQKLNINQEFYKLATQWKEDTRYLSSIFEISMHPGYQQIIGMGSEVLPLILAELKERPAHWFWALKSITRTDPVPMRYRGNIEKMSEFWLCWGREQGYVV